MAYRPRDEGDYMADGSDDQEYDPKERTITISQELDEILEEFDFGQVPDQSEDSRYDRTRKRLRSWADKQIVAYRNKITTNGLPLNAEPPKVTDVPCPKCGSKEYDDWSLFPHQVYNKYMPGGVGHYCFPCFCKIVTELEKKS